MRLVNEESSYVHRIGENFLCSFKYYVIPIWESMYINDSCVIQLLVYSFSEKMQYNTKKASQSEAFKRDNHPMRMMLTNFSLPHP